ncbi:hypothetical protein [Nitrosovibrio sp. Nv4]|uniref:hypothetical protein n=1 Tax=Nitrosovibrio sp. Nv4 TaxID=1945880 RepID=UPI000BCAEB9B|nr:hypothetical protein [Nitrosovibrio sp. Nv4]SOD40446.1 hypothetical protein SAMN06298226_0715 [Nitrosovibrio sp. Nv4]
MLHTAILALGIIIASNAFADPQGVNSEAGQVCPDSVPATSCEIDKDKATRLQNLPGDSIRLAAVDTQDEPRCAADGVCNLAVCSAAQDPDCPKDLPLGAGADPATTPAVSLETVDCTSTQSVNILAVAWNLVDDWANFERTVESTTGSSLGNCIRSRFRDNARVICEQQTNCNNRGAAFWDGLHLLTGPPAFSALSLTILPTPRHPTAVPATRLC